MKNKKKYSVVRDFIVYSVSNLGAIFKYRDAGIVKDFLYFSIWRKYRLNKSDILKESVPWIVFAAVPFLKKMLNSKYAVFEYGSGGSTRFWLKHAKEIISVEHDYNWYHILNNTIKNDSHNGLDYKLISPETHNSIMQADWRDPKQYLSSQKQYAGLSFEKYVRVIENYPDNYFDLIVVDGRARPSCIHASMPKLKLNGFLLVDNAERREYFHFFPELFNEKDWRVKKFTGHFPYSSASTLNQTFIFQKVH